MYNSKHVFQDQLFFRGIYIYVYILYTHVCVLVYSPSLGQQQRLCLLQKTEIPAAPGRRLVCIYLHMLTSRDVTAPEFIHKTAPVTQYTQDASV